MLSDYLARFARESDEIENIQSKERHRTHYFALQALLEEPTMTISALEKFVQTIEPKAFLRSKPEHRVWIGGREAPLAVLVRHVLLDLLDRANVHGGDPWKIHVEYENLHPFIDGNGRSGRALWLWCLRGGADSIPPYPFLRTFYYQTLSHNSEPKRT